jgi:hypothetical protein
MFRRDVEVAATPAGVPNTIRSDAAVCGSVGAAVDELGVAADILASLWGATSTSWP